MKKYHKLECGYEYDFVVLAINSHIKAYKLCWNINHRLNLNLESVEDHKAGNNMFFLRYKSRSLEAIEVNLLSNRSKKGYMIPDKKSINYFLIIHKKDWRVLKSDFLSKLRQIKDILLVFELPLQKEKYSDRFIVYDDKKN